MNLRQTRRLAGILISLALGLHLLAMFGGLTAWGIRPPLAAITLLTAATLLVLMISDRRQRKPLDTVGWLFIAWETGAAVVSGWAIASTAAIATWLLGAAAVVHLLLLIAILLVLLLIEPWRP